MQKILLCMQYGLLKHSLKLPLSLNHTRWRDAPSHLRVAAVKATNSELAMHIKKSKTTEIRKGTKAFKITPYFY